MFIFRFVLGQIIILALFCGLLFIPAGTLAWARAWVFIGVVMVSSIWSSIYILHVNKDLLAERMKLPIQKGQPLADKVVLLVFMASFYGLIAFIPMDVFRLHLMGRPGTVISFLGLLLFIAGWWIIARAMRENAFTALVVRLQEERGQRLIDTGPYAVVRHPMYSGCLPLVVGMSLWLQSYAAALFSSIIAGLLVVRIFIEESFLKRELKGYSAYMERVRYRLIPHIW